VQRQLRAARCRGHCAGWKPRPSFPFLETFRSTGAEPGQRTSRVFPGQRQRSNALPWLLLLWTSETCSPKLPNLTNILPPINLPLHLPQLSSELYEMVQPKSVLVNRQCESKSYLAKRNQIPMAEKFPCGSED